MNVHLADPASLEYRDIYTKFNREKTLEELLKENNQIEDKN
jgi:hypothetical protein